MSSEIKRLTVEGRKRVTRLSELRDALNASDPDGIELSDAEFAARYLPFHASTWQRLREDNYTGDTTKMERRCLESIIRLESVLEDRGVHLGQVELFKSDIVKSVLLHVDTARDNHLNANRLVVYLAETGGGKTALCRHIAASYLGCIIEGRESWRSSYTAGCRDVAIAAGATKDDKMRNSREAEDVMLRYLRKRPHVLCIDEANSFGPHTCNMVKLILNKTPTVVFMCAIPGLWQRMQSSNWFEASQLKRRAVAVVQLAALGPKDARPFLARIIPERSILTAAAKAVAQAASRFGLYDFVERIAAHLTDEYAGNGEPVTIEAVAKAIAVTRAEIGATT